MQQIQAILQYNAPIPLQSISSSTSATGENMPIQSYHSNRRVINHAESTNSQNVADTAISLISLQEQKQNTEKQTFSSVESTGVTQGNQSQSQQLIEAFETLLKKRRCSK